MKKGTRHEVFVWLLMVGGLLTVLGGIGVYQWHDKSVARIAASQKRGAAMERDVRRQEQADRARYAVERYEAYQLEQIERQRAITEIINNVTDSYQGGQP